MSPKQITLTAFSFPDLLKPKLGYSSRCSSTSVKLNLGIDLETRWKFNAINEIRGIYELSPAQFSCKSELYTLGTQHKGDQSSECGHIVSLVSNLTVSKVNWKFTRVKVSSPRPMPPPKQLSPPPTPSLAAEKTTIASVFRVTLPNGQACSSLSQAQQEGTTKALCARQVAYILSLGWLKIRHRAMALLCAQV
jgi:hypothetical protein